MRCTSPVTCGLLALALCTLAAGVGDFEAARMQSNPFSAKSINALLQSQEAKRDANNRIAEPLPGVPGRGPIVHRHIDSSSQCTIGLLHQLNQQVVHPIVSDLVRTTFFRFFKVATDVECPFWVMNRMCKSGGGCHICRCDDNEVPLPWRIESYDKAVFNPLPLDFRKWDDEEKHMWAQTQVEYRDPDATYVNLQENPESNTGYSGEEPRRIWDAIYQENCFAALSTSKVENMCLEERVFYRLLNGLHTSITAHVFARWKIDESTGKWRSNQGLWNAVMTRSPDKVDNLYFTLAFMLRALKRMSPYLSQRDYDTGNPAEDARTLGLVRSLGSTDLGCRDSFASEGPGLFTHPDKVELKDQLRNMFRNVSVIMNCVGCEKCKVWGKLNILGLGTALKVMISGDESEREEIYKNLQRNELVAFFNTINSFSEAVSYVAEFSRLDNSPLVDATTTENQVPPMTIRHDPEGKAVDPGPSIRALADAPLLPVSASSAISAKLVDHVVVEAGPACGVAKAITAPNARSNGDEKHNDDGVVKSTKTEL